MNIRPTLLFLLLLGSADCFAAAKPKKPKPRYCDTLNLAANCIPNDTAMSARKLNTRMYTANSQAAAKRKRPCSLIVFQPKDAVFYTETGWVSDPDNPKIKAATKKRSKWKRKLHLK